MVKKSKKNSTRSRHSNLLREREVWSEKASVLTNFVRKNLINRNDVYGRYCKSAKDLEKRTVRVVKEAIRKEEIVRHFRASQIRDIIGLHSTSKENTCRWLVIDIDHHSELDIELLGRNEAAVDEIVRILKELDMPPLVISSNGKGGFHIWIIFDRPISSQLVYNLGQMIRSKIKSFNGLEVETFPKQAVVKEGKYGNLIRLFGMHHTHDFYTSVLEEKTWLKGEEAIQKILEYPLISGDAAEQTIEGIIPDSQTLISGLENNKLHSECSHMQDFLSRLKGVYPTNSGFMACCPAHPDRNPSLSVGLGHQKRILIHCFRGCSYQEVLKAMELPPSSLFAPATNEDVFRHLQSKSSTQIPEVTKARPDLLVSELGEPCSARNPRLKDLEKYLGVERNVLISLGLLFSKRNQRFALPVLNGERQICGVNYYPSEPKAEFQSQDVAGLYLPEVLPFSVQVLCE